MNCPYSIHECHICTEAKVVYTFGKLNRELNRQKYSRKTISQKNLNSITVHATRSIKKHRERFENNMPGQKNAKLAWEENLPCSSNTENI